MKVRHGLALSLAIASAFIVAGCGGQQRSTAAFCSTLKSQQHQILAHFNATASGGGDDGLAHALSELGASVQVVSALRTYFASLADVAPQSIEYDAKTVAKAYDQELNDMKGALGHPFETMFAEFIDGAASSDQLNGMNQFALKNCGRSV